jgi:hypothetical protein
MKLSNEEYKEAEECLLNYRYNSVAKDTIPKDIINISSPSIGAVKAPYSTSDSVFNNYLNLEEDIELKKVLTQYKAVENAKLLLTEDEEVVLNNFYIKRENKYKVMDILHIADRTFARRKKNLIYKVHKELKKLARNWHEIGIKY